MMIVPFTTVEVQTDLDLSRVRRAMAKCATELSFDTLSKTRLVTAASELSRNMLKYGGGGVVQIDELRSPPRTGLRATFKDEGPGIPDPEMALTDGYSSGQGLGLGLGGAKRLVDDFRLETEAGKGTVVCIAGWPRGSRP